MDRALDFQDRFSIFKYMPVTLQQHHVDCRRINFEPEMGARRPLGRRALIKISVHTYICY